MRRAAQDLSRESAVLALQADSAVKIDAAEHAYRRLVAECAKYVQTAEAPAHDPVALPVTREPEAPVVEPAPEEAPERTPLAA